MSAAHNSAMQPSMMLTAGRSTGARRSDWTDEELRAAVGRWLEGRTTARQLDYRRDAALDPAGLPSPELLYRRLGRWVDVVASTGWHARTT